MPVRDESELERMLRLCEALGLPEVVESTSYGAPSLKVKTKNFASVRGPQEMVLHCPLEQKDLLMEMAPDIYWQTDHFKGWPGLLVRLEVIGDDWDPIAVLAEENKAYDMLYSNLDEEQQRIYDELVSAGVLPERDGDRVTD